ncbi:hypothetical protein LTR16_012195, partial [Cryomyces antarcticus]
QRRQRMAKAFRQAREDVRAGLLSPYAIRRPQDFRPRRPIHRLDVQGPEDWGAAARGSFGGRCARSKAEWRQRGAWRE